MPYHTDLFKDTISTRIWKAIVQFSYILFTEEAVYKLAGLYHISVDDLLHLSIELDENEYYDAPVPTQTSRELSNYLDFLNNPNNKKKL